MKKTFKKTFTLALSTVVLLGGSSAAPALLTASPASAASYQTNRDVIEVPYNTETRFDILENDILPTGYTDLFLVDPAENFESKEISYLSNDGLGVNVMGDNTISLTPRGVSGEFNFTYRVYNAAGDFFEGQVFANVPKPSEESPFKVVDDEVTVHGGQLTFVPTENDIADVNGYFNWITINSGSDYEDDVAYYAVNAGRSISVFLNPENEGFEGIRTIEYTATDSFGNVGTATVTFNFVNDSKPNPTPTPVPVPDPTPTPEPTPTPTPSEDVCEVKDFVDNPEGSNFYAPIRWMQCEEMTLGYANGTFGKSRQITRGETSSFLYRMADPDFEAPKRSPFPDMKTTSSHYAAAAWMSQEGIVSGYTDGTFRSGRNITRGEMAKIVYGVVDPDYIPSGKSFGDVKPGGSYYEPISWMYENDVVGGYSDGTYRSSQQITRAEVAKILHNIAPMVEDKL